MPFHHFVWSPEIIEHLEEHGITIDEFEEVVSDPEEQTFSRTSGRPASMGVTSTGKYIFCVYGFGDQDEFTVIPVTAYEV